MADYQNNTKEMSMHLYQKAFGRDPSKQELKVIHQAFGQSPDQAEIQDLLWATLLSPEFQFIY